MKIAGRDKLDSFTRLHADARAWIGAWLAETERTIWRTPQDIKERHVAASFLAGDIVIFNVRGNNYRLEVQVAYKTSLVTVLWAGTHEEYSKRLGKR